MRWQLLGQKLLISPRVTPINCLAKIELKGPGPPGRQYFKLLLYACTLYAKNAEETDAEETIGFFITFLSLVAFQLEGAQAPYALPGYAYDLNAVCSQFLWQLKVGSVHNVFFISWFDLLVKWSLNGFARYCGCHSIMYYSILLL